MKTFVTLTACATAVAVFGVLAFVDGPVSRTPHPDVVVTDQVLAASLTHQITDRAVGSQQNVRVSDALLVINDDGSATVSARLDNATDADVSLMSVRVESHGQSLPIASTQMWLPVLRGYPARVGDASDAGGFVVPTGLEPGDRARVQFHLDDGTCVGTSVSVVRRNAEHDAIFPTDGHRLGPATEGGATLCDRSEAADSTQALLPSHAQ